MVIFTIIILCLYVILIGGYIIGWSKQQDIQVNTVTEIPDDFLLSIIIPVRNEENDIMQLLKCLKNQEFPQKNVEIIVIDDHSTDKTIERIKNEEGEFRNLHIVHQKKGAEGKKAAIETGVKFSKGQYIVTTDADCTMGPRWLSSIFSYLYVYPDSLLIGPVLLQGDSFFQKLQRLEFLSLTGTTGGSAALGKPVLCNGANLIYPKKLFHGLPDPLKQDIASGDDMFFLENILSAGKNAVYIKKNEAVVNTNAKQNFIDFVLQRIRWASKGRYYTNKNIIASGAIVGLTSFVIVAPYFLSVFDQKYLLLLLYAYLVKSVPDYVLLFNVCKFFRSEKLMRYFIPVQFIYPFYAVSIALAGFLMKVKWKYR